jgi:hypothetical protein
MNVTTKIMTNNKIIEQVNTSNYIGYTITATNDRDLEIKTNKFNQMCNIITINIKARKDTHTKFYKEYYHLGVNAVWSVESQPTIRGTYRLHLQGLRIS